MWKEYFNSIEMLVMEEENRLNKRREQGEKIHYDLRRIDQILNGAIDLLALLQEKKEIPDTDVEKIVSKLEWLRIDLSLIAVGQYPLLWLPKQREEETKTQKHKKEKARRRFTIGEGAEVVIETESIGIISGEVKETMIDGPERTWKYKIITKDKKETVVKETDIRAIKVTKTTKTVERREASGEETLAEIIARL